MRSEDVVSIAVKLDRMILESRLRDISLIAQSDRSGRVGAISSIISRLRPGGYLLGCGPYCCGVLPLTVDEVVLGRPPSPLESVPDIVVDYTLNDAIWMVPREASRVHATIIRRQMGDTTEYSIRDENSRTGTYVNGQRVGDAVGNDVAVEPLELTNGDVISLGSSGINSYVFLIIN